MSESIYCAVVKKINLPEIILCELQQTDFIILFVDGGKIAYTLPAEMQVVEEFVYSVIKLDHRGTSIATDANDKITGPEHRAGMGNPS